MNQPKYTRHQEDIFHLEIEPKSLKPKNRRRHLKAVGKCVCFCRRRVKYISRDVIVKFARLSLPQRRSRYTSTLRRHSHFCGAHIYTLLHAYPSSSRKKFIFAAFRVIRACAVLSRYSLYDVNNDGCITREEMTTVITAIYDLMGASHSEPGVLPDEASKDHVDRIFQVKFVQKLQTYRAKLEWKLFK